MFRRFPFLLLFSLRFFLNLIRFAITPGLSAIKTKIITSKTLNHILVVTKNHATKFQNLAISCLSSAYLSHPLKNHQCTQEILKIFKLQEEEKIHRKVYLSDQRKHQPRRFWNVTNQRISPFYHKSNPLYIGKHSSRNRTKIFVFC